MSFSITFFDFGVLIILVTLSQEFLHLLLCRLWKIKVEEFSIFFKIKAPIFRKEIGGTVYLLGWIPYGSYIKPVGMVEEDLEKIHRGDLPFTFLGASRSKRFTFYSMPYLLWILVLLCCCLLIAPGRGFGDGAQTLWKFLVCISERFTGNMSKEQFASALSILVAGKSPLFLLLSLSMIVNITLTPLSKLSNWCALDRQKWPLKTFGYLLMIAILYFYTFKLLSALFAITGYVLGFGCLLSFSLGSYLVGTVAFFLVVLVAKLRQH
jgi:hypothetical protein